MNANTLKAITKHGQSLLAAFPNAAEKDPVALCKKLRRIETSLQRPLVDYCNGVNITSEELDMVCDKALSRVHKLLHTIDSFFSPEYVFVNRDPRGYALKLDDAWTRNHNDAQYARGAVGLPIYRDMGGYGILAPDLNQ